MRTTLNADFAIIDKIIKCSKSYSISEEEIVKKCILKVCNYLINYKRSCLREYQRHKPISGWVCYHYDLNEEENELFSKVSQQYKISISKMLFIGFILFFEGILSEFVEEKIILKIKKELKKIFNGYYKYCEKYQNLFRIQIE